MATADSSIVLLDFGGVLLKLRDPLETFGVAGGAAHFNERWLLSAAVRSLECGASSIDEFATRAVTEFDLDYGPDEFIRRFENWPDELYEGIPGLLDRVASGYTLALLSNTNPLHWNRSDIGPILEPRFDKLFLSWQTGKLKPDADAFEDVVDYYGVGPGSILFLDDNSLNIQAATACGMRAVLTRGAAELNANLLAAGLF